MQYRPYQYNITHREKHKSDIRNNKKQRITSKIISTERERMNKRITMKGKLLENWSYKKCKIILKRVITRIIRIKRWKVID